MMDDVIISISKDKEKESYSSFGGGLVTKSCPTLGTPLTVTRQAPLSMGFCRILQADSLLTEPPGKPRSVGPESKNKEDFCLITANLTPFTCLTKVNNISTLS